ncbi:MAG: transglutaminase-like domain-containing protein [Blastocatellia bacterium]
MASVQGFDEFIRPTETIESSHPAVVEFARLHSEGSDSDVERAVRLYYAVRDRVRYDPYNIELSVPKMKASATLESRRGWCVLKAILLAACCRGTGIPARLGFADVRNHLSTERLRRTMSTDVFYWHGYTEIFLDGKWVKATPAFNIELCEKFRLLPIEFDGLTDSLYHPYDAEGRRHMEYVAYRGVYSDAPLHEIAQTFEEAYSFGSPKNDLAGADFEEDAARENKV